MSKLKQKLYGYSEIIKGSYMDRQEKLQEKNEKFGNTLFTTSLQELFSPNNTTGALAKYGILYIFIIGLTILLSNLVQKKQVFDTGVYLYVSIFIVPILVIIGMIVFSSRERNKMAIFAYAALGLLLMVVFINFYSNIQSLSSTYTEYLTILSQIIIVSMVLVGLTLFYNFFSDKLLKIRGTIGIVINLIFLLPCFLNDFLVYIKNQFNLTPSVTYALLMIETILIVTYVYLPSFMVGNFYNSFKVLDTPHFLNDYKVIGHGRDLPTNKTTLISNRMLQSKTAPSLYVNYSISMWLYLNSQELSTENKHIFSYGEDKLRLEYISMYTDQSNEILSETLDRKHKLKITFIDDINCNKLKDILEQNENFSDELVDVDILLEQYTRNCRPIPKDDFIILSNTNEDGEVNWRDFLISQSNSEISIFIDIEMQKWNNIVVNYDNNNIDLFINGELKSSKNYVNMFPVYKDTDRISIGNNNLKGAICNIEYFENVLEKNEIVTNYNLLLNKNPPLNNIV